MTRRAIACLSCAAALLAFAPQPSAGGSILGGGAITPKDIATKKERIYSDVAALNRDIKTIAASMGATLTAKDIANLKSLITRLEDVARRKLELARELEAVINKYQEKDRPSVRSFIQELRTEASEDRGSIELLKTQIQ